MTEPAMEAAEFIARTRLSTVVLEAWIEAGWLMPEKSDGSHRFSNIDLARAQLILDLQRDMGVNDEAVPIILDLVDKMHGLRRTLDGLLSALRAQPETVRRAIAAECRSPPPKS